ncbi:hypothetical protein PIB30_071905 [Stylosanthes scabra]|uniref:Uncharacterized protein n=1 Tax=Stylosanthes scabra TaxID=79078 RepID=A0ABU6RP19_9FABA|nr:hypothetical protein [Stylosanthes scabra]
METRKKSQEVMRLRYIGSFQNIIGMDFNGEGRQMSGGLACLWDNTIDVDILSMSFNHLDMKITMKDSNQTWSGTAKQDATNRRCFAKAKEEEANLGELLKLEEVWWSQRGIKYEDKEQIENVMKELFERLFKVEETIDVKETMDVIRGRINEERYAILNEEFTKEEVLQALQ